MIPFALCLLAIFITASLTFVLGHAIGYDLGHDSGWDAAEAFWNADDVADIQWSCAVPPPGGKQTPEI